MLKNLEGLASYTKNTGVYEEMNTRNEMLVKQGMDKRARIKKEFLAHAEDFNNNKQYTIEKVEGGYVISKHVNNWSFKITEGGIEQLSEGPTSSSDYWSHAFMEAWMSFPKQHGKGGK